MTQPKIKYAGQGEKGEKKETRAVDPAVQAILMRTTDPRVRDMIEKVAKAYDLPVHGITVLGGSPYVNVTGLDERIQQKWLSKGWIKAEASRMIQYATKENNHLAGCEVRIEFFHPKAFNEDLRMLREGMTAELLKGLRETHTVIFTSEGWASPTSCQAIAYDYVFSKEAGRKVKGELLVENVNMMAERKASNRAKRAAVGCGLTSVEEVIGKDSVVDVGFEEAKEPTKKEDIPPEKIKKAVKKVKEEREKKEAPKPRTVVPTDRAPRDMTPEDMEKIEERHVQIQESEKEKKLAEQGLFFAEGNTISTIKKQKLMELYGSVPEGTLRMALDELGFANSIEVKTDKQAGQLIYALSKETK